MKILVLFFLLIGGSVYALAPSNLLSTSVQTIHSTSWDNNSAVFKGDDTYLFAGSNYYPQFGGKGIFAYYDANNNPQHLVLGLDKGGEIEYYDGSNWNILQTPIYDGQGELGHLYNMALNWSNSGIPLILTGTEGYLFWGTGNFQLKFRYTDEGNNQTNTLPARIYSISPDVTQEGDRCDNPIQIYPENLTSWDNLQFALIGRYSNAYWNIVTGNDWDTVLNQFTTNEVANGSSSAVDFEDNGGQTYPLFVTGNWDGSTTSFDGKIPQNLGNSGGNVYYLSAKFPTKSSYAVPASIMEATTAGNFWYYGPDGLWSSWTKIPRAISEDGNIGTSLISIHWGGSPYPKIVIGFPDGKIEYWDGSSLTASWQLLNPNTADQTGSITQLSVNWTTSGILADIFATTGWAGNYIYYDGYNTYTGSVPALAGVCAFQWNSFGTIPNYICASDNGTVNNVRNLSSVNLASEIFDISDNVWDMTNSQENNINLHAGTVRDSSGDADLLPNYDPNYGLPSFFSELSNNSLKSFTLMSDGTESWNVLSSSLPWSSSTKITASSLFNSNGTELAVVGVNDGGVYYFNGSSWETLPSLSQSNAYATKIAVNWIPPAFKSQLASNNMVPGIIAYCNNGTNNQSFYEFTPQKMTKDSVWSEITNDFLYQLDDCNLGWYNNTPLITGINDADDQCGLYQNGSFESFDNNTQVFSSQNSISAWDSGFYDGNNYEVFASNGGSDSGLSDIKICPPNLAEQTNDITPSPIPWDSFCNVISSHAYNTNSINIVAGFHDDEIFYYDGSAWKNLQAPNMGNNIIQLWVNWNETAQGNAPQIIAEYAGCELEYYNPAANSWVLIQNNKQITKMNIDWPLTSNELPHMLVLYNDNTLNTII